MLISVQKYELDSVVAKIVFNNPNLTKKTVTL